MSPVIPEEARNAPQHAEWLNGAGSFDLSHVGDLPAELIEDVAHDFLRHLIIAADEHRRLARSVLTVSSPRLGWKVGRSRRIFSACGDGLSDGVHGRAPGGRCDGSLVRP